MAAINPTDVTALIVDEFIRNATTHLTTISGIVNTLSLYPPIPTPSPGIVNWTGYTVPPATYTKAEIRDRIILNEILAKPDDGSVQLETDPEINRQFNENKGSIAGYRVDPEAGGFGEVASDLVVSNVVVPSILPASLVYNDLVNVSSTTLNTATTSSATTGTTFDGTEEEEIDIGGTSAPTRPVYFVPTPLPPYNSSNVYSGEGYGASVSFGKLSVLSAGPRVTIGADKDIGLTREEYLKSLNFTDGLTITNVDMSRDWATIATQYLVKKEGFSGGPAKNDEGKLRLGYGTDRILDPGATQTREVVAGDTTTKEQAFKVLELQVRTTYKDKVVGTSAIQITEAEWNALNDRQRAALVSFVYNCGSFKFYPHIPAAIKSKDYIAAANGLLNGPIGGAESGNIYSGLIRRRAEEAGMFAYGL